MSRLRDQSGFTVTELLVSMISFTVVFGAITTIVIASVHNQDRISDRVAANQRARPTMTRIIDQLHSACVAGRIAPIQAGSTGTQMTFLSKSGSTVTPLPDRRTLTLSGTNLTEIAFPAVGGQPPVWTYSPTPSQPLRTLMTRVSAPGGVMFRYYRYVNGQLSSTPLPTPLSTTNAAATAYVTVNVTVDQDGQSSSADSKTPITLSDAADLRLESAGQFPAQENLPCM
jgi:hypothetical protein